jgi:hypothetical protein
MLSVGALNRGNRAFVRVFIDPSKSTYVNYRVVGADLAAGVYGSKKVGFHIHYIMGNEREQQVRESLKIQKPVPEAALGSHEPTVAISGYGWKCIVEHEDPADPAGQLFEMSCFFGAPAPAQVIELWNVIEPGSADRILRLMVAPEGASHG